MKVGIRFRSLWLPLLCCAVSAGVVLACGGSRTGGEAVDPAASDAGESSPEVVLSTALGTIVIEVFASAAPETVARWLRLVGGPALDPDAASASDDVKPDGYYDGLAFTYTRPHVEIVTAARDTDRDGLEFDVELDATPSSAAVDLIERLRPERRFSSPDDLARQIETDVESARVLLSGRQEEPTPDNP